MPSPTFSMPAELREQLRITAARCQMSSSAFVCAAVTASIATLAEHDEPLRMMLAGRMGASVETREEVAA